MVNSKLGPKHPGQKLALQPSGLNYNIPEIYSTFAEIRTSRLQSGVQQDRSVSMYAQHNSPYPHALYATAHEQKATKRLIRRSECIAANWSFLSRCIGQCAVHTQAWEVYAPVVAGPNWLPADRNLPREQEIPTRDHLLFDYNCELLGESVCNFQFRRGSGMVHHACDTDSSRTPPVTSSMPTRAQGP